MLILIDIQFYLRVVRIENGRPTCLEFALCPCMPDIPKPKFFSASSEDELQVTACSIMYVSFIRHKGLYISIHSIW